MTGLFILIGAMVLFSILLIIFGTVKYHLDREKYKMKGPIFICGFFLLTSFFIFVGWLVGYMERGTQ